MMLKPAADTGHVAAVLGPTNTGKTHLAVERMLGYSSGVIGLPLRLLAREIYDRIVRQKGARLVALVTGEEKIVPPHAMWFVCTVEAMPQDRDFDFLAVDEIQLIGDPERGHVFTDRLLRARGRMETMFMGADTVRGLIRRLVPGIEFLPRTRLSQLRYAGQKKLSRLPPRSAIVAFSAADVYGLAELVRRQRGGAAVVLGALSPRTRNAQVALYQNGDVDFVVATDAIGMGLNMDIDHVAFAELRKFDGMNSRALNAAELGQIAGRAGRHMNDGTFGTTGDAGPLDADLVAKVEAHQFEPVAQARWRNPALDFGSLGGLIRSLDQPPPLDCLQRSRDSDDYLALKSLANNLEVRDHATHAGALRRLWQICQIPDFRKTLHDNHVRLLAQIFHYLAPEEGRLPADWVARQLTQIERVEGDIDTLAMRLAHIRTWTYVSHRVEWLEDARHWQERARAIEDRLSDALHERLTQRFVDRRSALLVRSLQGSGELEAVLNADGDLLVADQFLGRLNGLTFTADAAAFGPEGRALRAAANRTLGQAIDQRAHKLLAATDAELSLGDDAGLYWGKARVAQLVAGDHVLRPQIKIIAGEQLAAAPRDRIRQHLADWLSRHITAELRPLRRLADADLPAAARGIAFQLVEALGTLPRRQITSQIDGLPQPVRHLLRRLGVKIGEANLFLPVLLKPAATRLKCLLWAVHAGQTPLPPPLPGLTSFLVADARPAGWWEAAGFTLIEQRAVRVDILERVADQARALMANGPFPPAPELLALLGCDRDALRPVLHMLGYRWRPEGEHGVYRRGPRKDGKGRRAMPVAAVPDAGSPFAKLKAIALG